MKSERDFDNQRNTLIEISLDGKNRIGTAEFRVNIIKKTAQFAAWAVRKAVKRAAAVVLQETEYRELVLSCYIDFAVNDGGNGEANRRPKLIATTCLVAVVELI
jgi:hypothetical protein